ncbi:MAG: hypothetical protein WC713_11830 [Candidatus Methylomirabilota bacterium]
MPAARPAAWILVLLAATGTGAIGGEAPTADRGIAPMATRGFGSPSGAFRLYLSAPDAMLILDLDPPAGAVGAVQLDVTDGRPGVRHVELATGAGREALLPSGPVIPVPGTVVRAAATAGALFVERLREGAVRVSARGLVFPGGRSIDLAPRTVLLHTYPPSLAVPPGAGTRPGNSP